MMTELSRRLRESVKMVGVLPLYHKLIPAWLRISGIDYQSSKIPPSGDDSQYYYVLIPPSGDDRTVLFSTYCGRMEYPIESDIRYLSSTIKYQYLVREMIHLGSSDTDP